MIVFLFIHTQPHTHVLSLPLQTQHYPSRLYCATQGDKDGTMATHE